jgi:hypothetical protein
MLRFDWVAFISESNIEKTPWSESASELYRQSDRRLSAKWLPTFADKGCHVVSVTDPYGRILGLLDRSRFFFFVVSGIEPGPPNLEPRTLITRP